MKSSVVPVIFPLAFSVAAANWQEAGLQSGAHTMYAPLHAVAAVKSSFVAIENGLQQCVQINNADIVRRNNLTLLDADISVLQAIGYCGCKSAVAGYHLYSNELHLRSEAVTLKSSNTYSFVLATNDKAPMPASLRLQLSCGGN